ncbi:sensor histidine kinase [Sphingobacterium spiritivorum]|uniref:sensor histidine kinase n=1 Tax=Sphingobacterium spiritivorum TaxID=258 RepID=UPI003DA2EAB0
MKKLLSKSIKPFIIYSLVVLLSSIPIYYFLVDGIWLSELDEHNEIVADRTENQLNKLNLSKQQLSESIRLWNSIQPGTNLHPFTDTRIPADSTYTIRRTNPYTEHEEIDRFRVLQRIIRINGQPYILTVETNVEETEETVIAIAIVTLLFFMILVVGFLILNKRLSINLWTPFRSTLSKLKTFNLNTQTTIEFDKSDTVEFEELNAALTKLLEHNITVFKSQKEFTENASHELQTPLAIMKNKLDLLLQQQQLTEEQYHIIEDINKALSRSARINKNLLLLAKIENLQFDDREDLDISLMIRQSLIVLQEHADQKELTITEKISPQIIKSGNTTLIEILLNNIIINAIRHTRPGGNITLTLNSQFLEVSNSGNGPLRQDLLFNRFSGTTSESSGSGLGLPIIKEICKRQKWDITYRFDNNLHCFRIGF